MFVDVDFFVLIGLHWGHTSEKLWVRMTPYISLYYVLHTEYGQDGNKPKRRKSKRGHQIGDNSKTATLSPFWFVAVLTRHRAYITYVCPIIGYEQINAGCTGKLWDLLRTRRRLTSLIEANALATTPNHQLVKVTADQWGHKNDKMRTLKPIAYNAKCEYVNSISSFSCWLRVSQPSVLKRAKHWWGNWTA